MVVSTLLITPPPDVVGPALGSGVPDRGRVFFPPPGLEYRVGKLRVDAAVSFLIETPYHLFFPRPWSDMRSTCPPYLFPILRDRTSISSSGDRAPVLFERFFRG